MIHPVNKKDQGRQAWQAEISSPEAREARRQRRMFEKQIEELKKSVQDLKVTDTKPLEAQIQDLNVTVERLERELQARHHENEGLTTRLNATEHATGELLQVIQIMQKQLAQNPDTRPEATLTNEERSTLASSTSADESEFDVGPRS